MKSADYKAVQDAQQRYETYVQCRRFDLIVKELLSKAENISFFHSDLEDEVSGRENVLALMKKFSEEFERNGGFLRSDLSTSQVLEFSPDGLYASGTWLTVGVLCEQVAFGRTEPPYPMYRVMGQRHTKFALEDGEWRMQHISWKKLCELGPTPYAPDKCTGWSGVRERRWELPPSEGCLPWKGGRAR